MVSCHPMANGHGSNEPETTRTEPKGTDANRKTCKPTRGNDGGRLAGAVENRRNSNETHPEKRNSRMTDAPGGEPGSVILANSRKRVGFATTLPSSCGRLATRNGSSAVSQNHGTDSICAAGSQPQELCANRALPFVPLLSFLRFRKSLYHAIRLGLSPRHRLREDWIARELKQLKQAGSSSNRTEWHSAPIG